MKSPGELSWIWPSSDEINDFPDPLGFDAEWKPWSGTMADDGTSNIAEIFAREFVQNSWDSIQERTSAMDSLDTTNKGVIFRFVRLTGQDAASFAENFGLSEHALRFKGLSDKHRQDSRLSDSQIANGNFAQIDLLLACESWGEGMWGPWKTGGRAGVDSRLKSALMQTKSEKPHIASGGSWGHGKKGIANASKCRSLAVYTCSEPKAIDKDADGKFVTRRFLGISYWRSHDLLESAHVGLGLRGKSPAPAAYSDFLPLQDEDADAFITTLAVPGLEVRNHLVPEQTGVSYLIVEPSFSPAQLAKSVQRNWWPLLSSHPDAIRVVGYGGEAIDTSPSAMTELQPFIRAHRVATEISAPEAKAERFQKVDDDQFGAVGRLALTSDVREDGWSYADPETNASLVALVRNEMVIAYQQFPMRQRGKPPFVRGTFVVDRHDNSKASEALKMAEPHLHNEWITVNSPSIPHEFAKFADRVLRKIAGFVASLKSAIREDDPVSDHHYPEFSQLFGEGKTVTGGGDPPPPPKVRDFSIQFDSELLDANIDNPNLIRMQCRVKIALLPKVAKAEKTVKAEVDLGWSVLEERGPVRDSKLSDPSSIVAPDGIEVDGETLKVNVTATPIEFEWHSRFFPDDWQVVPDPKVNRWPPTLSQSTAPDGDDK